LGLQSSDDSSTLGGVTSLRGEESRMMTVELITALFYEVDEQLRTLPKHPEAHIPLNLVVAPQASHKPLDLSIRSPHDVSSAPMAICMEMRHGTDCQTDTRKPHHHHRFPR